MKQMIIKVDDDFTEIPEDVSLTTVGKLVGSKSWYNKILILCLSDLSVSELDDLGFSVVAIEGEAIDLDGISSYMADVVEFDGDGEEISVAPFVDLSTLQTFAGKGWTT